MWFEPASIKNCKFGEKSATITEIIIFSKGLFFYWRTCTLCFFALDNASRILKLLCGNVRLQYRYRPMSYCRHRVKQVKEL